MSAATVRAVMERLVAVNKAQRIGDTSQPSTWSEPTKETETRLKSTGNWLMAFHGYGKLAFTAECRIPLLYVEKNCYLPGKLKKYLETKQPLRQQGY